MTGFVHGRMQLPSKKMIADDILKGGSFVRYEEESNVNKVVPSTFKNITKKYIIFIKSTSSSNKTLYLPSKYCL